MSYEGSKYIGVSGVVNQEQQAELGAMFNEYGLDQKRLLNLGVKVTHKPQYERIENRHGREWYPVGDELSTVMNPTIRHLGPRDPMGVVRGIAQICLDSELAYTRSYRSEFWRRSIGQLAGRNYWPNGMQFDMLPDWCEQPGDAIAAEMAERVGWEEEYRKADLNVILQCQGPIMAAHSPDQIAEALNRISAASHHGVDTVLFDASGGRGIRMDSEALLPYIDAVYERMNVAVGGGLNADVVRSELPKILQYFPDVSWDAEGQLHPVNAEGKRPLDMDV